MPVSQKSWEYHGFFFCIKFSSPRRGQCQLTAISYQVTVTVTVVVTVTMNETVTVTVTNTVTVTVTVRGTVTMAL